MTEMRRFQASGHRLVSSALTDMESVGQRTDYVERIIEELAAAQDTGDAPLLIMAMASMTARLLVWTSISLPELPTDGPRAIWQQFLAENALAELMNEDPDQDHGPTTDQT